MRLALWPDSEEQEVDALLGVHPFRYVVLVAERPDGGLCGFAEAGVRDVVDGCTTSPVAYLEGIWVDPDARRSGVAVALVRRATEWAASWGLAEMGSDCLVENEASASLHRAAGFQAGDAVLQWHRRIEKEEAPAPGAQDRRLSIRRARTSDEAAVWRIFHHVVRAGDTYAYDPRTSREEGLRLWMEKPAATFVAEDEEGVVVGTYFLTANQPGLGDHVCNAGYMVAAEARGRGVGEAMCRHSLEQARSMGFLAMQFNLVVATNVGAIRLWRRMGFHIVGVLPGAYRHAREGRVDAVVMYRGL